MINNEFVDISTGEVLTGKQIVDEVLQYQQEAHQRKLDWLDKAKKRNELQETLLQEFGSFIFTHYQELIELLRNESGSFDSSFAFRFIYLSTFMDFDNKLRFGIKFRNKHTSYMTIRDFPEVLGLSKNQVTKFKNQLLKMDLLFINKDGTLRINKKFCKKGKLSEEFKRDSIRCFEEGIQELYLNSTAKEHKRLGILIQLLPYLNFNHNVLCWNPEELEAGKLKELKIQDICRIVGQDVAHARRFQSELFKITVNGKYVVGKFMYGRCPEAFIINPSVYYKGNSLEELRGIMNLFRLCEI
ncbi:MAG: hypothetical protein E7D28_06695 [Clostridium sp.]|uniref:hypothetical protein n=1 Tax=Clostridium sp. TaxID=1506 RepID=UPI00115852CF|nr:hypothetical protein [Clostridium sp.]MDU2459632.1 hypothetical protein [Clostridium sp.]